MSRILRAEQFIRDCDFFIPERPCTSSDLTRQQLLNRSRNFGCKNLRALPIEVDVVAMEFRMPSQRCVEINGRNFLRRDYFRDQSIASGNSLANSLFGDSSDNVLDGQGSTDTLTGNAGNDTFVFNVGQGAGDTVVDFAGNGAAAGDALQFVGYGAGATFTQNDVTHWQVNYNGGASHEVITFMNGASIDPTDFVFL